jgi:DNA-binding winged helix-turn-helix (wHTH) protein
MIRIGSLDVSIELREVLSDGQPVRLGSRAFDILALLVAADGKLVSRDEIMRHVWPATVVEENNLSVQINAIRRALGAERDRIRTESG